MDGNGRVDYGCESGCVGLVVRATSLLLLLYYIGLGREGTNNFFFCYRASVGLGERKEWIQVVRWLYLGMRV